MTVAYYYFPRLEPDEMKKSFDNLTLAVKWGQWFCEQNGGDEFSILFGRTFRTYHVCEGQWYKNGKSNKSHSTKSHSIKKEPMPGDKCRNRDPSTYSDEFKAHIRKKV